MTRSRGVGRGGARLGAGRPAKLRPSADAPGLFSADAPTSPTLSLDSPAPTPKHGRGGARVGAGRPPRLRPEILPAELDPSTIRRVLGTIVLDDRATASARVNAARALLGVDSSATNPRAASSLADLDRKTLEILNRQGKAATK